MFPLLPIIAGSLGITLGTLVLIYYMMPRFLLDYIQDRQGVIFRFSTCNEKTIFLTLDDSPTPTTYEILDKLDQHNVKASFFVINEKENFDEVIGEIHRRGHEVCNHTSHCNASVRLNAETFEKSLCDCQDSIKRVTGMKALWMRPGSGLWNRNIIETAEKHGIQVVLGDVYPHDAHIPFSNHTAWYTLKYIRPGSILILHDREWTISALDQLIPKAKEMGYSFGLLSDVYKKCNM